MKVCIPNTHERRQIWAKGPINDPLIAGRLLDVAEWAQRAGEVLDDIEAFNKSFPRLLSPRLARRVSALLSELVKE